MGATSVTGVGHGSADGKNKGSEHMTLGVGHLIGPRVVAAGVATLSSGTKTLEIPLPTGTTSDYVVVAVDVTSAAAVKPILTVDSTTKVGTLVLTGTSTDTVHYIIVKGGIS